ncbi:hypothetical protein JCM24511_09759 [Saitozyma sp. JCM 24511]|nr:hypothetical protein JCM24511_09759 [Saitozyma sp. JCM 24511]
MSSMLAPSPQPRTPVTPPGTLSYRLVTEDDFDLLLRYRQECGWGEDRLRENWMKSDYPLCVFVLQLPDGSEQDVGMGGWLLEEEGHASKKDGWVKLSSLFIDTSFQRLGLGRLAIGLLEELAAELFHAKVLTLDTTAYHVARSGDYPDWKYVEVVSQPSNNSLWYKKLGYEPYGDIVPHFPDPSNPGNQFCALFMKKNASPRSVTAN